MSLMHVLPVARARLLELRTEFLQLFNDEPTSEDTIVHHCGEWCGPCRDRVHTLCRMDTCLIQTMFRGRQAKPNKKVWMAVSAQCLFIIKTAWLEGSCMCRRSSAESIADVFPKRGSRTDCFQIVSQISPDVFCRR